MLPNSFQKGCNCTTAEYSIIDAETIRVINSCRKDSTTGELDQVNGKAFVVEGSNYVYNSFCLSEAITGLLISTKKIISML